MKRGVACLVWCALLMGAAAQAQERSITIWWAQWDPANALQALGNEFQQETGIAVKVHQIPWPSYQEQVFLNFGNKQTDFDIVVGDSQWIGRGATKGLYLDLTDWLPTAVDINTIHPRAAKYLCEYPPGSAKYFAAPCETDALGFMYRKDWFEDAAGRAAFKAKYGRELKTPDTWAEFRDLAEFFHHPEQKRYGCSLLTGREYDSIVMGFQPFLWSWGASWGDPATFAVKGHLNTPQAAEALQFLKDMLAFTPPGGSNADYFVNLEAFSNGSTAMVLDYFPFYPGVVASMGPQVGFFVMPGKDGKRAISLGGQGFSISTRVPASQQALAKQFIAWFQQPAVQEKWITYPGSFTANTALLKSEAFAKAAPYNPTFAASLDHLQDFWNVPVYNELLGKAVLHLGEALDGVKTPQAALDQLAEEHELIMQQAGLLK